MADVGLRTRVAYVRTSSTLASHYRSYQRTRNDYEDFLRSYVRQSQPFIAEINSPRHCFHFTLFTEADQKIFDILLDTFPLPPRVRSDHYGHFMNGVTRPDIHLHTSSASSSSPAGRRVLQQCSASSFVPTIHDSTDTDCDDYLLEACDYVIDINYIHGLGALDWFWNHARSGKPQDNMLSNPNHLVQKHDISRKGLKGRTQFSIWGHNSGCFHGNGEWTCYGCGGKCKRGRCKVSPRPEREVPEWYRSPAKGSLEWRELTSEEVCRRWRLQHWPEAPGKWHVGRDEWGSVDTFSGE